jgi:oligopeptide transport system permease protein
MIRFVLRRLAWAIPTLWVIVTLSFFMLRAAPGGPFTEARRLPPQVMANLERMYHLNEPVWEQYGRYLVHIVRGDFGPSYVYRSTTVNQLIAQGLPVDLTIGGLALALALIIGMPLGMLAALRQNRAWDHVSMAGAMLGISVPTFVVAPLLILLLAVKAHWLPAGGWSHGRPAHLVLPVAVLTLPLVAYVARLMRGSMIEVLNSPYIRTARAKGLPERVVLLRHALRPALMPLVSFLGPAAVNTLTGSIIVEEIFGLPGIGRFFVDGALNRDYTLVMGVTILYAMLIIAFNLLADVLYGVLDPRARLS